MKRKFKMSSDTKWRPIGTTPEYKELLVFAVGRGRNLNQAMLTACLLADEDGNDNGKTFWFGYECNLDLVRNCWDPTHWVSLPGSGWRPIESAPIDTMVLVKVPDDRRLGHNVIFQAKCSQETISTFWYAYSQDTCEGLKNLERHPTEWMPLPRNPMANVA